MTLTLFQGHRCVEMINASFCLKILVHYSVTVVWMLHTFKRSSMLCVAGVYLRDITDTFSPKFFTWMWVIWAFALRVYRHHFQYVSVSFREHKVFSYSCFSDRAVAFNQFFFFIALPKRTRGRIQWVISVTGMERLGKKQFSAKTEIGCIKVSWLFLTVNTFAWPFLQNHVSAQPASSKHTFLRKFPSSAAFCYLSGGTGSDGENTWINLTTGDVHPQLFFSHQFSVLTVTEDRSDLISFGDARLPNRI